MFASVALGMAVNLIFPGIPVAVTVAATMAGALVAALKAPFVRRTLHVGLGANRDITRHCCGRGRQRLADGIAGAAFRPSHHGSAATGD